MHEFGRIFHNKKLQFAEAVATLVGSIIGVGVLGMPYAVAQVGFIPGVLMLCFLAILNVVLQLMYAEIALRTKADHEIPGYGGLYLGFHVKMFSVVIGIIGSYGVILAYLIAQGQVLSTLFGGSPVFWSLLFYAVGAYVVYRGLSAVRIIELIMVLGMSTIFLLIGLTAHPHINTFNLSFVDVNNFIVPYGVLLFALSGTTVIPQIRAQMKNTERGVPWVIVIANVVVFVMYAVFLWLVLGVTGAETTQVATVGLGKKIGKIMLVLGNSLAFFTISTSFITLGLSMRRLFENDFHFPRFRALICTLAIPLGIFLIGARDFIKVVGLVGGIVLGVQNAVVIFAYWRSQKTGKRTPEFDLGPLKFAGVILLVVYVIGALLTVLNVL